MPHSFGRRARTRDKFSKAFGKKGRASVGRNLLSLKKGDYVDIVCDSSEQRGMPYQFYHGKTGVVFNVTPRAVGVQVNKVVGNRQIGKRIHIRIEHVRKSRCNEAFLQRVKLNDAAHHEAHLQGANIVTKRQPKPIGSEAFFVPANNNVHILQPLAFVESY